MKKRIIVLPLAALAAIVTTSCNSGNESKYFKNIINQDYEKYFNLPSNMYQMDNATANYAYLQAVAGTNNVNKLTDYYYDAASYDETNPEGYTSGTESVTEFQYYKNAMFSYKRDESQFVYFKGKRSDINIVGEENIYWPEEKDGEVSIYTEFNGRQNQFVTNYQNKYSGFAGTLDQAKNEMRSYFAGQISTYADATSGISNDSAAYINKNNDEIYIFNRGLTVKTAQQGSGTKRTADYYINQYKQYLYKIDGQIGNQFNEFLNNSGVYYIINPLKTVNETKMIECGVDFGKALSYFLPVTYVSTSFTKLHKVDGYWHIDYIADKDQTLLLKNEYDKLITNPLSFSTYYRISAYSYDEASEHSAMAFDEKKVKNNPFNFKFTIWGEDADSGIQSYQPFAEIVSYTESKLTPRRQVTAISSISQNKQDMRMQRHPIYDLTEYYRQANPNLPGNVHVYNGYIDSIDYIQQAAMSGLMYDDRNNYSFNEAIKYGFELVANNASEETVLRIGYDDILNSIEYKGNRLQRYDEPELEPVWHEEKNPWYEDGVDRFVDIEPWYTYGMKVTLYVEIDETTGMPSVYDKSGYGLSVDLLVGSPDYPGGGNQLNPEQKDKDPLGPLNPERPDSPIFVVV